MDNYTEEDIREDMIHRAQRRNLHFLCILTFLGSGLMALSGFMVGVMLPSFIELYQSGAVSVPSELTVALESALMQPQSYYILSGILYSLSLLGAVMMWNVRKQGFHMYTLAQILLLFMSFVYMGREGLRLGDIMMTALFVVMYYVLMKNLGSFYDAPADEPSGKETREQQISSPKEETSKEEISEVPKTDDSEE